MGFPAGRRRPLPGITSPPLPRCRTVPGRVGGVPGAERPGPGRAVAGAERRGARTAAAGGSAAAEGMFMPVPVPGGGR